MFFVIGPGTFIDVLLIAVSGHFAYTLSQILEVVALIHTTLRISEYTVTMAAATKPITSVVTSIIVGVFVLTVRDA